MERELTLSVITVTWNSREFLERCTQSVAASAGELAYEHIIVDNASSDRSAELAASFPPPVTLIRNPENLGFSRANNVAVSRCRGRYVLFLNPDTEVLENAIPKMLEEMERRPELGALGPRLLDSELKWSSDMGYRYPSLRTLVNTYLGLCRLIPYPEWFPGLVRSRDFQGFEECDWISGAAFMVRREVLEQERWDDSIFFYGEDVELCDRIRRRGWRVGAVADASVVHHSGQSMSKQSTNFLAGKSSGLSVYLRRAHGPVSEWLGMRIIRFGYFLRSLRHALVFRLRGDPSSREKTRRLRQYLWLDRVDDSASAATAPRGAADSGRPER